MEDKELEEYMNASFSQKMCITVEQAIRLKFPTIENLFVSMNDEGQIGIMFDEVEITQKQMEDFLEEFKKLGAPKRN